MPWILSYASPSESARLKDLFYPVVDPIGPAVAEALHGVVPLRPIEIPLGTASIAGEAVKNNYVPPPMNLRFVLGDEARL